MVYEGLLMLGVSTRNVENIFRFALANIAGIKVDRLPLASFARYMLMKACGLAQYQITFELADDCCDMTFQSQMEQVMVGFMCQVYRRLELLMHSHNWMFFVRCRRKFSKVFDSIKNLMSYCCVTQKENQ